MKKIVAASALALTLSVGLATSPKAQASSSAKVYFKQYKETKKFAHNSTATFSYQLPQLKGNSAAVKKINSSLRKSYRKELKMKSNLFAIAKNDSIYKGDSLKKHYEFFSTKVSYNKNNIISFKTARKWYGGLWTDEGTELEGWTFSLRNGKALSFYDVAKDSKPKIIKRLNNVFKKEAPVAYGNTNFNKAYFYMKGNKVYLSRIDGLGFSKPLAFTSRYK